MFSSHPRHTRVPWMEVSALCDYQARGVSFLLFESYILMKL